MKDGKCPKCGGTKIFKRERSSQYALNIEKNWTPTTYFDTYICRNCRYMEFYFSEHEKSKSYWEKLIDA